MCGIAGIFKFDNSGIQLPDLKKMTDAIQHRGPDGEGQWLNADNNVGLGHRRLSIIDLSEKGKQPMHYASGRYTITFNGEIYNYIELKKELQEKKYEFRSDSDTEVLMAIYDLHKEKCLEYLDGMFAFAIWDEKEKKLFCARDRFGEKPFYYYTNDKQFLFASEMKSLWRYGIKKEMDDAAFNNYLNLNIVAPSDPKKTFYKGVFQLENAHCLTITANGRIEQKKYYSLDTIAINTKISFDEAVSEFYRLLSESVRLRLRSDVPVGSSLSGGLDSSSIVALIDKIKGATQTQKTFSARFKNFKKDEGFFIEKVVQHCKNVKCEYTWPDAEQFLSDIDQLSYHQEEPFGSSSIYAQYKVMELAKKNDVTVLLDGQGADEQLGGYLAYYGLYLGQLFYHNTAKYKHEYSAFAKYHYEAYPAMNLLKDETIRMKLGRWRRKVTGQPMPVEKDGLKKAFRRDLLNGGLKHLLRYADRNSMAHSREVRLPFLSHHFVEFVMSLPDNFILSEGWTKYVMRKAMENDIPKEIAWRVDKTGYETPEQIWLSTDEIKNRISEQRAHYSDLIGGREVSDWQVLMLGSYYK